MRPLRILVAEDDAMVAGVLWEILHGLGHDVCAWEVTQSGTVEAALRERPDLMLLDQRLADGSGETAAAAIQLTATIPFLYMSGDGILFAQANVVVLRKPFRETDLIRAIDLALPPKGVIAIPA